MARFHPVVQSYLDLAELGTMTEPEGRSRVKEMWPEYANQVDQLVEDFKAQALGRNPLDQKIRDQFEAMRQGSVIPTSADNMTEAIRKASHRGRVPSPEEING
jgi:hypothetical protein